MDSRCQFISDNAQSARELISGGITKTSLGKCFFPTCVTRGKLLGTSLIWSHLCIEILRRQMEKCRLVCAMICSARDRLWRLQLREGGAQCVGIRFAEPVCVIGNRISISKSQPFRLSRRELSTPSPRYPSHWRVDCDLTNAHMKGGDRQTMTARFCVLAPLLHLPECILSHCFFNGSVNNGDFVLNSAL